ncbi:MAG TPA: vitamin K epoxide reductase family protein [Acidimicrobiales bacterium]|nr:vitamin K epoxide reductase family protein [Acidimicrobiales bacterium]
MATSRTAAQRRRARAIARESARPRGATPPLAAAGADLDDEGVYEEDGWYVPARRWPWVVGTLLCVLGLGVAAYLTWVHYHPGLSLACPEHGIIDCAAVTSSEYSKILGVPVALLGLLYFVGMLPLQLPWAWRSAHPWVRIGRLFASIVGVGMIVWLVYAELFLIGKICIYCTSVHVLTFLLFVVTLLGTIATTPEPA